MALGEFLGSRPSAISVNSVVIPNCKMATASGAANLDRAYVDDLKQPLDGGIVDFPPEDIQLQFRDGGKAAGSSAQARDIFAKGAVLATVVITRKEYGKATAEQLDVTITACRVSNVSEGEDNGRLVLNVTLSPHTADGTTAQSSHAWS